MDSKHGCMYGNRIHSRDLLSDDRSKEKVSLNISIHYQNKTEKARRSAGLFCCSHIAFTPSIHVVGSSLSSSPLSRNRKKAAVNTAASISACSAASGTNRIRLTPTRLPRTPKGTSHNTAFS